MKSMLPEVLTIEPPEEISKWPELIKNLDCFSKEYITQDDYNKKQYAQRALFINEKKKKYLMKRLI